VTYKPPAVVCILCHKRASAANLCANQDCGHMNVCKGCGRQSDAYSTQCWCRSKPDGDVKFVCHSIEYVFFCQTN